jgi:hypothetical protein
MLLCVIVFSHLGFAQCCVTCLAQGCVLSLVTTHGTPSLWLLNPFFVCLALLVCTVLFGVLSSCQVVFCLALS